MFGLIPPPLLSSMEIRILYFAPEQFINIPPNGTFKTSKPPVLNSDKKLFHQ